MVKESNIDKYFNHFNAARMALSECKNMTYQRFVPFDEQTAQNVSNILQQLDDLFLRLYAEAVEWMDEMDYIKKKGS